MATMVSLKHRLLASSDEDVECRFFKKTLDYLTTSSGYQVKLEDWMVTSYDVEFEQEIGSGGLYVLSTFPYLSVADVLTIGFLQWESIQRDLEQDQRGTQIIGDGRWYRA
jgi:hypothetical protein